jgi:hypothetical protein
LLLVNPLPAPPCGPYKDPDNTGCDEGNVPADTTAIQIASNDVTIDLNGFAIIGDSSSRTGIAIADMGSRARIAIRNGSIDAFPHGIDLSNSSHMIIEQMNLNARFFLVREALL